MGAATNNGAQPIENFLKIMTEDKRPNDVTEDKRPNEKPRRMINVAFPKAQYGVILAITIIFIVLFILYKDVLFSIIF